MAKDVCRIQETKKKFEDRILCFEALTTKIWFYKKEYAIMFRALDPTQKILYLFNIDLKFNTKSYK